MKRCLGCFAEIRDELEICPFCGYMEGTPPETAVHMVPGTILDDRYIIGKVVGFGGFGVTYSAWDGKLLQRVAIKEYLPSEFSTRMPGQSRVTVFNGDKSEQFKQGLDKFVDEARRLAKFTNEDGIVRVFDCIESNDTAYIVMEFLEGETLTDYLKRTGKVPEDEAVEMLLPIMESLKSIHSKGIIHRDIAPDNIFLTSDGKVKLIDFGASRFATTSHSRSLTVIVKPGYSAEEQYMSRGDQGPHTDVYSLAATLYKMITGTTPPDALERRAKLENVHKDIIVDPRKIDKGISVRRENAIMNALNIRVEDRTPTIEQFMKELESDPPVPRRYGKIKKIDFYTWPLWLKVAAPLLCAMILTFGVLVATGVINFKSLFTSAVEIPAGYSEVPDVTNKTIDEAKTAMGTAQLNIMQNTIVSDHMKAGYIINQNPKSGRFVPINSDITLYVSMGNGEVILNHMPYFEGVDVALVYKDLRSAGFAYTEGNEKYEYSDTIDEGKVVKVFLDDGTEAVYDREYASQTHFTLCVSLGRDTFAMPELIGKTEQEARDILKENGLVLVEDEIVREESDTYPAGIVSWQSISSGNKVKKGTEVKISVSTGVQTKTTDSQPKINTPAPTKKPNTNTPTPTKKPNTPTPVPSISAKKGTVEIRHDQGKTSGTAEVNVTNWASSIDWKSSNTGVVTVSGSGASATLNYQGRGTTTVTATLHGTNISCKITVKCYDSITKYTDWVDGGYQTTAFTDTDIKRLKSTQKVEIDKYPTWCYLQYWRIGADSYGKGGSFYNYEVSGRDGKEDHARHKYYNCSCDRNGVPNSNNPIAVPAGGNNMGCGLPGRGYNRGNQTAYYFNVKNSDGSGPYGNMYFIYDYHYETVYETRYYYQTRTSYQEVSCD